ncbi:MAG: putative DNA repair protein MutK [Pseudohongiellaceae bacterium]|jgi:predicted DNA repair protein MutK
MASVGLLALIDDIATLLDDVALLTKVAAKKTAGVLGDDLALNAQQVSGVRAERELPVVWAVAKGSAKNKVILVPAALMLSAFFPWTITPLLMLGGAFLCFEGFEKIFHSFLYLLHKEEEDHKLVEALADPDIDMVEFERQKIKGAIRTDFILSAEIVVIALGTVQEVAFIQQVAVVSIIAIAITLGVYGTVAGIVKLDDAGLYLMRSERQDFFGSFNRGFGKLILASCPYLMKTLSVVGTAAMFLVGGGILVHGLPMAHELLHHFSLLPVIATFPEAVNASLFNALVGILAGALLVAVISGAQKIIPSKIIPNGE